ncbi:helix-turn-helix transcriptional regulator [Natronorarus salvus]|uniref:helix-turn-helix transcriptional regulator n=1 Tax=Natronorarus salvus TaxID=3117733 RepID=UPI002F261129
MKPSRSRSPVEDIAYLTRADHRVAALAASTVRPRSRSELVELTGVSSSTIRRTIREFEDRNWVRKVDYQYETTQLGAYIASGMVELIDRVETEQTLRDVWGWLPGEESGFTIEMVSDAAVTVAAADAPYAPVNRFVSLFEGSDRFRAVGFDVALLEPCRDELCRRLDDGMHADLIAPPRVANYIRSTRSEQFSTTFERGDLTIRLHDDLPSYGVCLFDDRVAISGYGPEGVTVRVLVDSDAPAVYEWAESTYTAYRRTTPTLPLDPIQE